MEVSVIVPIHNAERYVRTALESIQRQTLGGFEVIVVDDGSSDGSLLIVQQLASVDSRVRVCSKSNRGIVHALNDGLALAKGSLIARMDADDVAAPDRLERQCRFLHQHPACVALGMAADVIDTRGAIIDRFSPPLSHDLILEELLNGNGAAILHPAAMFRAEALRAVGNYDPEFALAEDVDVYFRLSRVGELQNLPEVGLSYRHHFGATSFRRRIEQVSVMRRILERERARRGLPPVYLEWNGPLDQTHGRAHAHWACTALKYGNRATAIRHAFAAVSRRRTDLHCWKVLRYVLTAKPPKPHAP